MFVVLRFPWKSTDSFFIAFVAVIVCFVTVSCMPMAVRGGASDHGSTVDIRLVDIENTEPMLYGALLEHPQHFTTQEMTQIMSSLRYSSRGVIGWDAPQPIFLPDTIAQAVPLFRRTLEMASPFQKVLFTVTSHSENTSGDLFLMDGHLHWRFDQLNGTTHFDPYPSPVEFESETEIVPNWIVRPIGDDQRYERQRTLLGLQHEMQNWVKIRFDNALRDRDTESADIERSFVERLAQLRDLFKHGLISDTEYQRTIDRLVREAEMMETAPHDRLFMLTELHKFGFISADELARKRQRVLDRL